MRTTFPLASLRAVLRAGALLLAACAFIGSPRCSFAQDLPSLINVVDYTKLLPLFPEAPAGWTADQAEGSTDHDTRLTTAHRDYRKGETESSPSTSISILDASASPDYVESTMASWKLNSSTPEGYTKSVTIEGNPGFETFETEEKHGTLWLLVAKRYFLQIETQAQEAKELQEWVKRVDLKKLAEIK